MTNTKIKVVDILFKALMMPLYYWKPLARAIMLPAILFILIDIYLSLNYQGISNPMGFLLNMIKVLLFIPIAVTVHRIILLGEGSVPKWGLLKYTKREWKFLGWLITVYLLVILFMFILSFFTLPLSHNLEGETGNMAVQVLMIGIFILISMVFSQLSLLFPATAIDKKTGFDYVVDLARGNRIRLFITVGLLPILLSYVLRLVIGDINSVPELLFVIVVGLLFVIVEISALSLSYKELVAINELSEQESP